MSTFDTPERRLDIRRSAEVSAAKHLARTHGILMRRRRRVGPVIFDLGTRTQLTVHGQLEFTDTGVLVDARLFGTQQGLLSFLALGEVLEFGSSPEVVSTVELATEIVLDELPDLAAVLTGPILLPTADTLVIRKPEPTKSLAPLRRRYLPVSVDAGQVVSRPYRQTLPDRQRALLAALPKARRLWSRFLFGVVLVVQIIAVLMIWPMGGVPSPQLLFLSIVIAVIGLPIAGTAMHANDTRLEQLRAVGLR